MTKKIYFQGEIEEAIRLFQQAADLREENLGCLHPLVAADLANLAVLLSQLVRFTCQL